MAFQGLDQAFATVWDLFQMRMNQGGVNINNQFPLDVIQGATEKYYRQFDAPNELEHYNAVGSTVDPMAMRFWRRKLVATPWKYSLMLDQADQVAMGGFDIAQASDQMYYAANRTFDKIILDALIADVFASTGNVITWDKGQMTIAFNDPNYLPGTVAAENQVIHPGKIIRAVEILRANGCLGPLICIMSFGQQAQLMTAVRMANLDWNIQPAQAAGVLNPYGGVSAFFPTMLVPQNVPTVAGTGTRVDVAYVVAPEHMRFATAAPLMPKMAENPERNFNKQLFVFGSYGAVRLEEGAVVAVESTAASTPLVPPTAAVRGRKKGANELPSSTSMFSPGI
jgi:hypothetical protein